VKRVISMIILVFLLILPLVTGATLKCPPKAPTHRVVCRFKGNGTGEIYLKSVDGLPPRAYLITIKNSGGYKHSINDEWDTFKLPANVSFSPVSVLGRIKDYYFSFVPDWVLFNKEHTFTFVFIEENGTQKEFDVRVYLEGTSNWTEFKKDLEWMIISFLFTWFILSALFGVLWLFNRRLTQRPVKFQIVPTTSGWIAAVIFGMYLSHPFIFGLPYYFGGGSNLWGDIVTGWSIWALVMVVPFYIGNYLLIPIHLKSTAYHKPLPVLKKRKLAFCSGLVWIIVPLLLISGALDSEIKSLLLMSFAGAFAVFTHHILKTLKPEGVLFINLSIVGFLTLKYHPDFVFVVLLVILLFVVYLLQRGCFIKFNEEKERLIGEIYEKVKLIQGTENSKN